MDAWARRAFLVIGVVLTVTACATVGPTTRRGPFAFHYGPGLSASDLAWYSRFDLLITHDPLPADQVNQLRRAGTKLILYEWSVAFYETRATAWQRSLPPESLLGGRTFTGGAGSPAASAWYFDPGSADQRRQRALDLISRIRRAGYAGVFFDTTTIESVHPEARVDYERRHPHLPYDASFSHLLVHLREEMPDIIIFTNQGYRSASHYLPHVDWDLTESLITGPAGSGFAPRKWSDPASPWSSIHHVMRTMIEPLTAQYPHVRFANLNYVADRDEEAILLVTAVSQLFGSEGYVAGSAVGAEISSIYFREPGRPSSMRVDHGPRGSHRFFENGLIAVTAGRSSIEIQNPARRDFRNRATGILICGEAITLRSPNDEPTAHFLDYADCDR